MKKTKERDCRDTNLMVENEQKREKPATAPIKKKTIFTKSPFIKYGSGYADQGGGSKIRTTYKDFDESFKQPKRKTFKEFLKDSKTTKPPTARDMKNLDFMRQVFYSAKEIEDFELFIGFINHLL